LVVNGKRGNLIPFGIVEVTCQRRIEGLELAGRVELGGVAGGKKVSRMFKVGAE